MKGMAFKKYKLTNAQLKAIANLCVQENGEEGVANEASLMANLFELQSKYKTINDYVRKSGWFSRAAHWMDAGTSSSAAVAKVKDVLVNANRTLPPYVNEHDATGDIQSAKNGEVSINKKDPSQYKRGVTRIKNVYGSTYTYYCHASSSKYSDPMGYTDDAYKKYATASQTTIVSKSSTKADQVIAVADGEVGYLEKRSNASLDSKTGNSGSGNYTKYWRDMDKSLQGQPWCDCFVSWCFKQAFGSTVANKMLCGGLNSFYTPDSVQYFKNKGQWHSSPKVGDQIFFRNSERINHTGIVYKVDSSKVYTIEGNTSSGSAVIPNGGAVCKKSYDLNNSRIAGYGRPAYSVTTAVDAVTTAISTKKKTPTKLTKTVAWYGYVTASSLNVREWAGTENDQVSFSPLPEGTKVGVCAQIKADDGSLWYYIKYGGKTGFVSAKYIK